MLYAAHLSTFYFALYKCALHYVKFHTTRMYSHTSRKICDSFALQNWGVDLYAGHEFFRKADDVSWDRDWRTLRPVARRSAPVGHWHVTLVCVTWYCSKMNGRAGEEYSAFRAALSPADHRHGRGWHMTDIASGVRCHSGSVGRGRTAPRRTLLWSAVNLVAIYALLFALLHRLKRC